MRIARHRNSHVGRLRCHVGIQLDQSGAKIPQPAKCSLE
jgi:hypothetical protein